jgi:Lactonase, 7-bladed beta-propeller
VTAHDGVVYVLNANGAGNITGFRNLQGVLMLLAGSSRPLSAAAGTGLAQVGFSPDGDVLLVTEKGSNKLTSYRVTGDGTTDAPLVTASSGITPFGFAFDRRGHALVSEAFGGAANRSALSSYGLGVPHAGQPGRHQRLGRHHANRRLLGSRHAQWPLRLRDQHRQRHDFIVHCGQRRQPGQPQPRRKPAGGRERAGSQVRT